MGYPHPFVTWGGRGDPCHKNGGRGSPSQARNSGGGGDKPDLDKRVDRLSDVNQSRKTSGGVPLGVPRQGVSFSGSGGGVLAPPPFCYLGGWGDPSHKNGGRGSPSQARNSGG